MASKYRHECTKGLRIQFPYEYQGDRYWYVIKIGEGGNWRQLKRYLRKAVLRDLGWTLKTKTIEALLWNACRQRQVVKRLEVSGDALDRMCLAIMQAEEAAA